MSLIKQPFKGMRDILPKEKELRDYVYAQIESVYKRYGFNVIETPVLEHIENLSGNMGGENEKLVFQVLKRGEKLSSAIENKTELCDGGLRYDLTMPLTRYFACNMDLLPYPFKTMQFGDVFRADRPQKGRTRQFKQCDIDILGESGIWAEIELLSATTTFLKTLQNVNFTIKINDRRILKALCEKSGFNENNYDDVLIALDKLDKIGVDGVRKELLNIEQDENIVNNYIEFLEQINKSDDKLAYLNEYFNNSEISEIIGNIKFIIEAIKNNCKIDFDITIVRGMGYYTGTIYEIYCDNYGFAIGGGGRYDNMVGGFAGQNVPAVGISIGFERLILLLTEIGYEIKEKQEKIAILFDGGLSNTEYLELLKVVNELRQEKIVYLNKKSKNVKRQKETLFDLGFCEFIDVKSGEDINKIKLYKRLIIWKIKNKVFQVK